MWVWLNDALKRKLPRRHAWLKARTQAWRLAPTPMLPVPRRIRGEFFWVHPQVLTAETADAEPHICQWILESLPKGGVFFDVGAHYGWVSLKTARHVGSIGHVVAFEPSPVLLKILKYHQQRNHLPQMTIVGSAVSEYDLERTTFHLLNGGLSSRNSLMLGREGLPFVESGQPSCLQAPSLKLDTFCESTGLAPNVIKIDVEGAEGMVLRGALQVLRQFRPVLVISIHPYWLPASDTTESITGFLEGIGYRVRRSHVIRFGGYDVCDYLFSV